MTERRKVVLVEPEASVPSSLAGALDHEGWEVLRSSDPAGAFQQSRQARPDAVVVHERISGGGGLTLLRRLRSSAHTALIPVIALLDTASSQKDEFGRWGAQVCLEGLVDDDAVCAEVRRQMITPRTITGAPEAVIAAPSRLNVLVRSGLLDTPPEELFDRVTRLAAHVLDVPTVLMSLVDRHRQFFKSQVGLDANLATARQTPLSYSFCQWVVASDDELVVPDARDHPLLRMNPATTEFAVAYAGIPLRAGSDETIGSFCAIDTKPHMWDAADLAALRDAATVIEGITVLRQGAHARPLTPEDVRATSYATGLAVHAAARLLDVNAPKMSDEERRELLTLTGELGRQLADLSVMTARLT
jgi:CheY-like chemotaxis protein